MKLVAPTVQADKHSQRELGQDHLVLDQVTPDLNCQVQAVLLQAAVQQLVVDSAVIRYDLLCRSQDLNCHVKVPRNAVALCHKRVGDGVHLAAVLEHGSHDLLHLSSGTNAGLGIEKAVVDHGVHRHPVLAHLPPHLQCTEGLMSALESFDEGGVNDKTACHLLLPRSEEAYGLVGLGVADERVKHASKNQFVGLDVGLCSDVLPEFPAQIHSLRDAARPD
mmetsp:Transcript_18056/g.39581  ORF Transcript_18056/g.39581 Transcript_18056/m.39581 type:complete len:221 (+) Transcript_18056:894-1556(+)